MTIKTNKATASGSAILASGGSHKFQPQAFEVKPAANKLLRALDRGNSQDSVAVHSNRPSNVSNCKASRNSSKFNSERGSVEVQKAKSKSLKMKLKINVQPTILSG